MSEIADSIGEAIRRRVVSATLGTYLFFWCVLHWEGIYVTLFTNQDIIYGKFGLLKNEYINQYFFGWHGWISLWGYVIPLLLTIFFVWPIPKYVLIHAYRQEQRHKVDRRRVKIEEEQRLEVKKERLAIQTQKTLEAAIDVSKTEKQAAQQDPKIIWQSEYEAFARNGLTRYLLDIAEAIYKHEGQVSPYYDAESNWVGIDVSKDGLAIAHTNDLISMSDGRVALTEKGKYFLSQSYFEKFIDT